MKTRRRTPAGRAKVLALAAELTIAQAGTLKTRLTRLLDSKDEVRVDAGATRRVDTACLQLLLAFVRDRRNAGKAVTWKATAPEFTTTAKTVGLAGALGIP
jgi:anti-anti-sigma regulatory factor